MWGRFEEALFKPSDSTLFECYVKLSLPFHEVCSIYLFICSKVIVTFFLNSDNL